MQGVPVLQRHGVDGSLGFVHPFHMREACPAGRLLHEILRSAAPFYRIADDRPFPVVHFSQMAVLALAFIDSGQIIQKFLRQLPGPLPLLRIRAFQIHLEAVVQNRSLFGCLRIAAKVGVIPQALNQGRDHGRPVVKYDSLCPQPFPARGNPVTVPFYPDDGGARAEIDANHPFCRHKLIPSRQSFFTFSSRRSFCAFNARSRSIALPYQASETGSASPPDRRTRWAALSTDST